MNITKIKIKNLFGISEYEADGKSVELSGKNGAGKTSVIDAIRYALTNKSDRKYIVRNGETEGEILIETDNGLRINRKARTTQADYKSVKQNGKEVGSPETFLRDIFTPLQLNPVEFLGMSEKQQNAIILDMIDYPWGLDKIREWFGEIGAEPDILCELSNYMDAVALVEQGVGLSIFPQTTYTPNDLLVSKVITQPARKAEYVLVWEREHRLSPLMEAFVDYVRDFLQEDMIHSQRFRAREEEYALPGNTVSL